MAYGIEVRNRAGNILFSSEEPYKPYIADTPTTVAGYGNVLPLASGAETYVYRPPNGVSGAVAIHAYQEISWYNDDPDSGLGVYGPANYISLGIFPWLQAWGASDGIKYTRLTQPNVSVSTGYGLEVRDVNSNIVFSTEYPSFASVEAAIRVPFGTVVKYWNTGNDFNNLYVALPIPVYVVDATQPVPWGLSWYPTMIPQNRVSGLWTYFNNTEQSITIANSGNVEDIYGTQKHWYNYEHIYTLDNGLWGLYDPTDITVLVVRVRGV